MMRLIQSFSWWHFCLEEGKVEVEGIPLQKIKGELFVTSGVFESKMNTVITDSAFQDKAKIYIARVS